MVFDANATVPMLFCIYIYIIYIHTFLMIFASLRFSAPVCRNRPYVWDLYGYMPILTDCLKYIQKNIIAFSKLGHIDLDRLLRLRGSASHLSDELDIDSTSGCRFFVAAVFWFEKMVPQERRGPKSYVWAWIYFGFLLKHLLDPFGTFVL